MTLLVFFAVLAGLLILRLVPGLLLRLALAIPRQDIVAFVRSIHRRKIGVVLSRGIAPSAEPRLRLRLVLVSSSLLVLALLATTAYWSSHTSSLMMLLR